MTSSATTLVTPTLTRTPDLAGREVDGPPDRTKAFDEGLRQGRLEERRRHRGHPLLALLVVAVAAAGAAVIALAAHEGSFSRGGAVVDRNLAVAADNAQAQATDAANKAGAAVKDAGAKVEQKVSDAVSAKH